MFLSYYNDMFLSYYNDVFNLMMRLYLMMCFILKLYHFILLAPHSN